MRTAAHVILNDRPRHVRSLHRLGQLGLERSNLFHGAAALRADS